MVVTPLLINSLAVSEARRGKFVQKLSAVRITRMDMDQTRDPRDSA